MANNPLLEDGELPKFSAIQPEHVEPALVEILRRNRKLLDELLSRSEQAELTFEDGILPIESLAQQLHRVWSPVSHLHAVKNSPELRAVYNDCLPVLARYQTEIAQDERLYRLYENVQANLPPDRRDGASSLLRLALRDFRLAGVNLPPEKKQRFKAIMEELTQICARFDQNVLDSMAAWSHHETTAEAVAGIPATVLEQAAANAREKSLDGWLFSLNQPTYIALLTHADNPDLRHQIYRAWMTRASDQDMKSADFDNTGIMERILLLRHEAAALVGYENFAEYSLASKMAGSVNEVCHFLEDLARRSRATAARELKDLEHFAGRPLAAWDIAFYGEKLRQERFSVSDEQLRPYFPLDSVLDGLFAVVNKLYGLTAKQMTDVDTWQADVRFYQLLAGDGEIVGGFFIDLFARSNKVSGAWMDECINRMQIDDRLQRPVAHLNCNFAAPTESTPCLLTHDDVVTLFHEFGHTLHHLMTRVPFPSVSGINGVPWDAVELPSQFMENFAWQPEAIEMISGHYETGEPLPSELLEKLRASRVFHAGLQMVRQVELALFDIRLHAEFEPETGSNIPALIEEIRDQVAVVKQPEFNRFAHAFSHIFGGGYAAGYYSYKWAEVLAADAWSAFEERGVLSSTLANRFRETILEIGGTVEIGKAFEAFRGRPPKITPLLIQAGILDAGDGP
jgi:oligopeptidase A